MKMQSHQLMVSLDSILDTRIGAVAQFSQAMATQLLETNLYRKRRHNCLNLLLPYIDGPAIDRIFTNRSVTTLKLSPRTPILELIKKMVNEYRVNLNTIPEPTRIMLSLNTWPYTLTVNERNIFKEEVTLASGADVVKMVNIPVDGMTPLLLSKYDSVIWHELDEWVTLHMRDINFKGMAKTTFHCPEIITSNLTNLSEIPEEVPGRELRFMLSEYIKFDVMPLEMFSIYPPT